MSRHPFAGASHRLHLGEHALVLDRLDPGGGAVTVARVAPPPGGMVQALRALAAEIDGPVVAVLPAEVFRTRPAPAARAARRTAEAALAVALGVPARATRFAEVAAGERRVLVAVPRSTLSQTAAFLAAVDIALTAVEPEAALLPGMPVPRFELATRPRPALAELHAHLRARFATALGALALPRPGPRAAVLAGAGLLALTALWGLSRPVADLPGTTVEPEATASVEVPPPPVEVAAAPEPPATTLAQPPQPRPRALPPLTLLTSAAPLERRPAPVGLGTVPSASDGTLAVTMASRSLPLAVPEMPTVAEAARKAAAATEPERPAVESYPRVAALGPVARPSPSPDAAAPQVTEPPMGTSDAVRPLRRPGATTAAAPNAAQLAPVPPQVPAPAGERPVARPGTPAPSLEAAIAAALAETSAAAATAPSDAGRAAAGLAAAVAVGVRPAPRSLPPVPEVPRRAVATVAPPPPAQPVAVAALAPAAQPPVQLVPTAAPPRQAPQATPARQAPQAAPVRQVVRAAPQPARTPPPATVARAAPAAAPAAAPPAPQQQASPGRGPVALVGVFGSADRRHALLQMPNGSIQRVRAGQTVAGVQVAAVAGDSVRVLVNGRESTLRLPD